MADKKDETGQSEQADYEAEFEEVFSENEDASKDDSSSDGFTIDSSSSEAPAEFVEDDDVFDPFLEGDDQDGDEESDDDLMHQSFDHGSDQESSSEMPEFDVNDDMSSYDDLVSSSSSSDPSEELMEKIRDVQDYVNDNKQAVAAGFIVFVVVLYLLFGGSNKKPEVTAKQSSAPAPTLTSVAEKEAALEAELKTFESQFSEATAVDSDKVNALDQKVTMLFEQLKSVNTKLMNQEKSINQLKSSIKSMLAENDRVSAMAKRRREAVLYTVNAIVPGRVWLKAANGHEFTASVGDRLDGYGTILKIEADYGRVVTSTGRVIYTGNDDG